MTPRARVQEGEGRRPDKRGEGKVLLAVYSDDANVKQLIATHLRAQGIPFIDVGMGIEEIDGKLSGLLRVLFADADADPRRR